MHQSHLLLDEMDLAPSVEWEPPRTCWRFVRISQGQGYWLGAGEAREFGPGDVLVLAPQQKGEFRASQLGAMKLHYFRFCPDLMGGLLTMTERTLFERLNGKSALSLRIFPSSHPVAALFGELCARASAHNCLLSRCRMVQVIATVFERELSRAGTPERSTLSASKRIKVLMQHLTEEEFLNSSADELAAYCGCSLRHFSRLFLQTFDVSLRTRQTDLRLLKARRLLVETDSRVATVAGNCGYRHLGVFNALFKKRFGMTPTEWRKTTVGGNEWPAMCTSAAPASPCRPAGNSNDSNGAVVTEK